MIIKIEEGEEENSNQRDWNLAVDLYVCNIKTNANKVISENYSRKHRRKKKCKNCVDKSNNSTESTISYGYRAAAIYYQCSSDYCIISKYELNSPKTCGSYLALSDVYYDAAENCEKLSDRATTSIEEEREIRILILKKYLNDIEKHIRQYV